jgi:dihydroorotate dehydrogenase
VEGLPRAGESGGLSGAPLAARSTDTLRELARALAGALPVIGVGGIMSAGDAAEKLAAGARLVQLYTGLVYRGPALVRECVAELCQDHA